MTVPPYPQSLFEKATAKMSKTEQKAINQLLSRFQDVLSKDEIDLGKTNLVEPKLSCHQYPYLWLLLMKTGMS